MKNKEYVSIKKMIEYIEKALRYTSNCSFQEFTANEEKVDVTILQLVKLENW